MMYQPFRTICDFCESMGRSVFGAIKVQCPVWVLHLKMQAKDNDAFFPVDKAILKYSDITTEANFAYLARLIGMNYEFIRSRVKDLEDEGYLSADNIRYSVTEKGRIKYLADDNERPNVTIYQDLVVDGISLKPLDKDFYSARASYIDRRSSMIVPAAIMDKDDPMLLKAVSRIEKMTGSEKEEYLIDRTSHDYQIESYELKSIDNVYIVLSFDRENKKYRRDVFFRNRFISKVDSLETVLDNYYLQIKNSECHSSEGYNHRDNNPFMVAYFDEIKELISTRYSVKEVHDEDFTFLLNQNSPSGLPLIINISDNLLERSGEPAKLMSDALSGQFDMVVKEGTYLDIKGGFGIIGVTNSIPEKIERYRLLNEYVHKFGRVDMAFIKSHYPTGLGWRKEFVDFGLLEELEDLDIEQFIKIDNEKDADYE